MTTTNSWQCSSCLQYFHTIPVAESFLCSKCEDREVWTSFWESVGSLPAEAIQKGRDDTSG